ncbi:MAG TPA: hypothetical protein VFR55_13375, partial [Dehalococcoidia bacterium]|nr:hypothetical protein [Dehalococcoidia bacterium]
IETPTLVGIWDTAPYLHNGQALTLHDVLSNPTHIDIAGLTPTEVNQLVSYLLQIDLVDLPETSISSGPPVITPDTSASFSFTASLSSSTFECDLDGSGFRACASPQSYSALAEGSHIFQVRGTDPAGNTDPTPANHTWTVDNSTPSGPLVTNIVVSNGKTYLRDALEAGKQVYRDRSYTFTSVPSEYVGQELIITANNDKTAAGPGFLTFTLTADATVYVLYDSRATILPA